MCGDRTVMHATNATVTLR